MAGFTSSSLPLILVRFTFTWYDLGNLVGIISCSLHPFHSRPFTTTLQRSRLSFAFGTNDSHCKSSSGWIFWTFWTNIFSWKDQWHIVLYREGSKCIPVFKKPWENYKLNQYVQQNACSLSTDSGYSWRFFHAAAFFFPIFCFWDWNMET